MTLDDFQKVSDEVPFLGDLKPSGATSAMIHPCGDPSTCGTLVTYIPCPMISRKCACTLLIAAVVVWSISILSILVQMSFSLISLRGNVLLLMVNVECLFAGFV